MYLVRGMGHDILAVKIPQTKPTSLPSKVVASSSTCDGSSGSTSHCAAGLSLYTSVFALLEVCLFLLREWRKLYVDEFLSTTEELDT